MQALAHFIFTHFPLSSFFSLSCDALHFAFVFPVLKPINCVQARPRQGVDCALWMKSCWHIFVQRTIKGGNGISFVCAFYAMVTRLHFKAISFSPSALWITHSRQWAQIRLPKPTRVFHHIFDKLLPSCFWHILLDFLFSLALAAANRAHLDNCTQL